MKHVDGDLIEMAKQGQFNIIVHGCNCMNTMGKGIAAVVKTAFPSAYQADQLTVRGDRDKLGKISFARQDSGLYVVNAYTQYDYWSHGQGKTRHADYDAIDRAMWRIARYARDWHAGQWDDTIKIGIPLIGAGLAGGDWNVIEQIVLKHLDCFDLTLVRLPS